MQNTNKYNIELTVGEIEEINEALISKIRTFEPEDFYHLDECASNIQDMTHNLLSAQKKIAHASLMSLKNFELWEKYCDILGVIPPDESYNNPPVTREEMITLISSRSLQSMVSKQ